MSENSKINRRLFIQSTASAGAGLLLSFYLPANAKAEKIGAQTAQNFAPNVFLRIQPDDKIFITVTRMEMGQGVRTALPMMLADELEVDLAKIELEQAEPGERFKGIRMRTSGSGSIYGTWAPFRRAGAAAREMLVSAAAQIWNVSPETCRAENGSVLHVPTGKKLSYGKLAETAAKLPVPEKPALKQAKDFRYIGKRIKRIDSPKIVRGGAVYGCDIKIPKMLVAVVERSPVLGGKFVRWDDSKTKTVPGVRAVLPVSKGLSNGVAVLAENTWAALKGRELLQVVWDEGKYKDFSSENFNRQLYAAFDREGYVTRKDGDAQAAFTSAETKLEAVYEYPYQAHAPLETMNCIADVRPDGCEIWVGTQAPERAQEEAAKLLGIDPSKVRVHVPLMGGGFGRRLFVDYVTEAVELSKAAGAPVKVFWTRADDMKHGYFHSQTVCRLTAGLSNGKIVAWTHKTASSDLSILGPPALDVKLYAQSFVPWGGFDNPYSFPALQVEYHHLDSPVPTGPWRAVGYPQNVFARECFIDEAAHAAGQNPLDFRLALMQPLDTVKVGPFNLNRKKLAEVLRLAAERGDLMKSPPKENGRRFGRGIACNIYHGETCLAQVAEVSVGEKGDVRVHRIITAVDCGQVVNPLGLEGQIESGIAWGLNTVLRGQITFKNGGAEQSSYGDFEVLRINEMPPVETFIVPNEEHPKGIGEQPVPVVAPAVCNAIFAATGNRIRRLPVNPAEFRAANNKSK